MANLILGLGQVKYEMCLNLVLRKLWGSSEGQ